MAIARTKVGYESPTAIQAGTVVIQGGLVGVSRRHIKANGAGQLLVTGVVRLPKADGAGTALSAGDVVYWDATTGEITTTVGTNVKVGKVVHAAGDTDHFVRVLLTP